MPRHKGIGMPKPKKAKLQDANDEGQPSIVDVGIDADPGEGVAARPSPVVEPLPPPSPGGLALKELKRRYDEAILKARAAEHVAKRFKAEERKAERLCDAKFKRAESKQTRKPKKQEPVRPVHADVRGAEYAAPGQREVGNTRRAGGAG